MVRPTPSVQRFAPESGLHIFSCTLVLFAQLAAGVGENVPSEHSPGFAAGRFIKFGRASPPMVPHTGHKIVRYRLSLPAERADAQGRRFVGHFNADCQCSGSLARATKI
jgi:hypothetical protein